MAKRKAGVDTQFVTAKRPNIVSHSTLQSLVEDHDDESDVTDNQSEVYSEDVTADASHTAVTTPNASTRYPCDEKTLPCPFSGCTKAFNRPARLTAHLRSHTNDRPYKCTFKGCDKDYREKKHLEFHIQGSHQKLKEHACPQPKCGKAFSTSTRLRRHQLVHEGKERFRCRDYPPCDASFRKHQTLQRHIRTEHLHEHAFPCKAEGCDAGFPTAPGLRRHTEREHGELKYWCDDCAGDEGEAHSEEGRTARPGFRTLDQLQAHIRNEHLNCIFCDAKCKGQWELNRHIEMRHSGVPAEDRKVFPCPWAGCGKKFTQRNNLNAHVRSAHEGVRFVCGEVDVSGTADLCEWADEDACGQGFVSKSKLETHIRHVHLGHQRATTQSKPAGDRTAIMDQITGVLDAKKRTIPCSMAGCEYRFVRHTDLQAHLKIHPHAHDMGITEASDVSEADRIDAQVLRLAQLAQHNPPVHIPGPYVESPVLFDDSVLVVKPKTIPAQESLSGAPSSDEILKTDEEPTMQRNDSLEDDFWIGARDDYGATQHEDDWFQEEMEMRALVGESAYPDPEDGW